MRATRLGAAAALICGFVAIADLAKANLLVNGGFEDPIDFFGWVTNPVSFPQYIVTDPVHGDQKAAQIAGFDSNPDTLSQTVSTVAGEYYELSFWRSQAGGAPPISLTVTWNGTEIFSETNTGARPYEQFTFLVLATGSDLLVFKSANNPSFTYLDDVSLDGVAAVPVPGALPLFASGLGLLGFAGWRRRRKAAA